MNYFEDDKMIDRSMRVYLSGLPINNDEFEELLEMKLPHERN